jgi:hypothetical protein
LIAALLDPVHHVVDLFFCCTIEHVDDHLSSPRETA